MVGKTIAHYEVLDELGAGGMGVVYRARDTRLDREVAIKALPEAFAQDPERLARFEREAKVLASINHTNIAAIHGLEKVEDRKFLVLELVEGETLAERISRGPIPVGESLKFALQIAEGLEAAHEKGIIHRDLKPANVKITPEGQVKVLDFGLAKVLAPDLSAPDLSQSPTLTQQMTGAGVLLGTASYMSPEQARGQEVDKRADIWAFGCVLYEMLSGRRAFAGDTVSDVLAALLAKKPDWEALPAELPAAIHRLLGRCLERDARRRRRDIGDVRLELEDAVLELAEAAGAPEPEAAPPSRARRSLLLGLAGGLALGLVLGLVFYSTRAPSARSGELPTLRLSVKLPKGAPVVPYGAATQLALSSDGSRLLYVATANGTRQLFLRSLDRLEAEPVPGSEGASSPIFSPDGEWVLFEASGKLKKLALRGGPAIELCEARNVRGASWGADGTILFGIPYAPLQRVSAAGGARETLTHLTPEGPNHRWPQILPGGKAALFTINAPSGRQDEARIAVVDLASGDYRILLEGGTFGRYAPPGHLVYAVHGALFAAPFDLDRLEVKGPAIPVESGVAMSPIPGTAHFDLASTGVLAYLPASPRPLRSLVWVERNGDTSAVTQERRPYSSLSLSPGGERVAVEIGDENMEIWIYELERESWRRVTFEKDSTSPVWSPDGRTLAFSSNRNGNFNVFSIPADGSDDARQLTHGNRWTFPASWTPDGKRILVVVSDPASWLDILSLSLEGEPGLDPVVATPFHELDPALSPDGRWLAYASNESGSFEIYVRAASGSGQKWLVSQKGGTSPVWSPTGKELFYRHGDKMMAILVKTEGEFKAGVPEFLFEGFFSSNYAVAPDGQRFLMIEESEPIPLLEIVVVPNWFEELERLVDSTNEH